MPILEKLQPQAVFAHFEQLCAIPHGSGNTKAISDYLVRFAAARGLRHIQDEYNNVIIFCPGTPGYETAAPIVSPSMKRSSPSRVRSFAQSGAVSQTMSMCPCRMTGAAVS